MAEQEFYPILTKTGKEKEMACLDGQTEFDIWEIAVGDGNGALYEPDENQTSLKNECWRGLVAKCENEDDTRYAIVHIPADIGGFTIREIGAFDKSGNLLIVAKCAETVKRLPETGDIKQLSIRLDLSVINELVLPFLIDPSINTATVEYCDKHYQNLNQKAQPEGYAPLDDDALLPVLHLPDTKHQLASLFPSKAYSQAEYPKEYAAIVEQASSSFDLSKVNYSGNPTITGDGLAILNSGGRIILPVTPSMFKGKSWSITIRLCGDIYMSSYFYFYPNDIEGLHRSEMGGFGIYNNECYFWGAYGENKSDHPWQLQTDLDYENYFDITYAFDISTGTYTSIFEGDTGVKTVKTYTPPDDYSDIKELYPIYNELDGNCILTACTQDLKNMRIVIDGEEISLYAKTAIDTIKAPDYTVVGSPTITADGVLSNGVIYSDITLASLKNKSWTLSGKFVPSQNGTATVFKFGSDLSYTRALRLTVTTNKNIVLYGTTGTETDNSVIGGWESFSIGAYNSFFNFEIIFDLNTGIYTLNIITDIGNKTTKKYTPTSTSKELITINEDPDTFIAFGQGNNDDVNMPADAYLDLNSLKLSSNGYLVYQLCLLIPYTESTSGTKIVDAAYLDRVQDCFEHTGEARYITLDKENSNFYLPKGCVISMLSRDKTNTDKLKNNIDTLAVNNLHPAAIPSFSNPEIYDYWQAQAHSTFDLNKFKLEGSPTIAVDGNVIIDSTSKSVRTKENINTTTANNLYAEYEFVVLESDGASSGNQFFLFNYATSGVNGAPNIQIINSNLQLSGGQRTPVTVNTHYRYTVSCTNTANNNTVEKLYADDVLILSQTSTKNWRQNNPIWFGKSYSSSSMIAVLLPKIRVWVDDKPVFSGNKIAIDTIKAPDYTVVGSPTISADGIASGFSVSDYLAKDISDFSSVDFEFYFAFSTTKSIPDNKQTFVSISLNNGVSQFFVAHQLDGSVVAGNPAITILNTTEPGKFYFVKFAQKDGIKKVYVLDNGAWVQKGGNFTSYPENVINKIFLGRNQQTNNQEPVTQGSIDLNYVSLYINGQLAWQPCLYIPYTESTSGTKIVDAAYLDRVQSCYEQTGQALYLTLDRSNQRVYQPKGSLTGFLSKNALSIAQNQSKIETNIEQISQINQDISSINDDISELTDSKAEKTDVVNLTGNQTIQDTKTFEEPIVGDLQGNSDSATVTKYSGDAVFPAQGSVEVPGELPVGLSFTKADNSPENSPAPYGHLINLRSTGSANTQLFLSWNASNDTAAIYYRSHRASGEGAWTPWKTLAFTDSTVAKAISDANGANIADTYLKKDMENLTEAIKSTIYATGSSTNLKIPVDGTSNQVIIKSGGITSPAYITFPEAFPTACSNVVVTCHTTESCVSATISDITRSGFNVRSGTHGGKHEDRTVWVSWIAIGY